MINMKCFMWKDVHAIPRQKSCNTPYFIDYKTPKILRHPIILYATIENKRGWYLH